jgi:hypothetical protein
MDEVKTGEGLQDGASAEEAAVEEAGRVEETGPGEAGAEGARSGGAKTLDADTILDTIVPESIDWRDTVQRHPVSSVLAVAVAGYILGRTRGSAIVAGLTAGISSAISRQLSDVLEGDFFEFE